jgi:hypothetical protein
MQGRSLFCLLAVAGMFLLPCRLHPQADRALAPPDFSSSDSSPLPTLPPHTGRPQAPPVGPAGAIDLAEIARAAETIFSGTVTGITRHADRSPTIETVAITFHVEQVVRGAKAGQDLTIRQWMGAWTAGQRYRVGERVFLFLYPASKLGLTSSVNGSIGRFRIDPGGHVWLSAQQRSAFRKDPVLGGRSLVSFGDFARAVQRASEEE